MKRLFSPLLITLLLATLLLAGCFPSVPSAQRSTIKLEATSQDGSNNQKAQDDASSVSTALVLALAQKEPPHPRSNLTQAELLGQDADDDETLAESPRFSVIPPPHPRVGDDGLESLGEPVLALHNGSARSPNAAPNANVDEPISY